MYWSRMTPYVNLPPSSPSLQGHLQHCFFIIRMAMNLLDNQFEIDPLEFGWREVDGYIVPDKQLLPLPDFYLCVAVACRSAQGAVQTPNRMLHAQNFVNVKGSVPICLE